MSACPKPESRSGLTLAEMMVALIISSIALAITAQAAATLHQWTTRLDKAHDTNAEAVVLYHFVERVLSEALPLSRKNEDGMAALFEGDANAIRFVRAEPGYPSRAGLYQYYLFARATADGQWDLVLHRELFGEAAQFGSLENPTELVVYTGDAAPAFSYFGANGWQGAWSQGDTSPQLVGFGIAPWPVLNINLVPSPPAPAETGDIKEDDNNTVEASR